MSVSGWAVLFVLSPLYLNYQHRAFVFTHEMLAAMGKPAFVSLWVNYGLNVLLFEARRSRPKSVRGDV